MSTTWTARTAGRGGVWVAMLLLGLGVGARGAEGFDRWEKEIAALEAASATAPRAEGPVLFIGSSSIRLWKSLAADYPQHSVVNHGFGGSQIVDSVHFFDRLVVPVRPRLVVMYAGGNDIHAGKSPERVLADFSDFARLIRGKLPGTGLTYISIAPNPARWAEVERVRVANGLIREFCRREGFGYIDVFSAMLGEDGLPKEGIYVSDRLHMNENGYRLWRGLVAPFLPQPAVVGK